MFYKARGDFAVQVLDYPFDGAYILQKKRKIKRELLANGNFTNKKIAIMSGSTIGEIKNILELFLLKNGIMPEFYIGGYSLYYENVVFDDGELAAFKPDIIYIHTSAQNITEKPLPTDTAQEVEDKLEATFVHFKNIWDSAKKYGCPVIQNNFEMPFYRIMGNLDCVALQGFVNFTNRLNTKFAEYANSNENFFINDINYLSASVGLENWFNPTTWYAYKYSVDTPHIATLCHSVASIIKSIFGKNKKCVVLDLDNTLWGGIIGDDGAQGILLGKETPTGMAYSEFQTYLKNLSGTGVMLSVCSKNEEKNALEGFERDDSVLKRDDFVNFKANWEPKHLNIDTIAKEINIGLDSLVFIDDNPAEREIVRTELGEVSVPEVKAVEMYIKAIDKSGFFEVTTLSEDDKRRSEMYKENAKRANLQQSFGDYNDYLRSLNEKADIGAFNSDNTARITQLINKTNQFNMTTRRYTQAEVESAANDNNFITIYGRLVDKFGDNGIITAIIAEVKDNEANIDLWIMSCRTFKRCMEYAMFDKFVEICNERGITKINGYYSPTAKNLLVSDFYDKIGFELQKEDESGNKVYVFNKFDTYKKMNEVIDIT